MLPYTRDMLSLISQPRFILFSMISHTKEPDVVESEEAEARALIETYGGEVVRTFSQNESHMNQGTYIGRGKLEEIAAFVADENIHVVVVNGNLSSSQLFSLKSILGVKVKGIEVWDRIDLILHIFKKHATTAEAKLQIRLAETRHKGPELHGMGKQMSQQGAGIGTRGAGETQTEIMKRHWRSEIQQIEAELAKLVNSRLQQMDHRKRLGLPTISLVGYTNAGKSTLFNLLTKKNNLVKDAPFATLDSSVGKLYLHGLRKESFITDTIGFIQNLSTELVDAFQSTLAETVHADLLLHVIDISDAFSPEKIETVEQVLSSLKIDSKNKMYVFTKIDRDTAQDAEAYKNQLRSRYKEFNAQFVSSLTGAGVPELIAAIEQVFVEKN